MGEIPVSKAVSGILGLLLLGGCAAASLQRITAQAEAGDLLAMKRLSSMYCAGIGVERDLEECKKWKERAERLGAEAGQ
jgi:TPR repeat protein